MGEKEREKVEHWGQGKSARVDVCIPVYRIDPTPLIHSLFRCDRAEEARICVCDDGSGDPQLSQKLRALLSAHRGPGTLITLAANRGRSGARNALIAHSQSEWLLFLDADTEIPSPLFLVRYFQAIDECAGPALVVGGCTVPKVVPAPDAALRHAYGRWFESASLARRRRNPQAFVHTSNALVHRSVVEAEPFDEGFVGWGWEDIEWGMRVGKRFPIVHIDNLVIHTGLENDAITLKKVENSALNFVRFCSRHPKEAKRVELGAFKLRTFPPSARNWMLEKTRQLSMDRRFPMWIRLTAFQIFKSLVYANAIGSVERGARACDGAASTVGDPSLDNSIK
ncbi:MAG: glycosyltransferase family 2 protein [Sandaracinaceae bacterium]|nr:glycosyltransferase family 2 protein [Sandaracinaceae bacterium]